MGIILGLFLVSLAILGLTWATSNSSEKKENVEIASMVCAIILPAIVALSLSTSYGSYVNIRTKYDATIAQYKGAITLYGDRAHIDVEKAALVDFRYQGYQANMGSFVRELRKEIVRYNKELISKRIMKKNFMFNWLIIAPDEDMKIISMVE